MDHRLLLSLPAALFLASAAGAAERNYTVTDFDRVRVDGGYHVTLTTGVSPFARASGDSAALDSVSVEVQGRTLIVRRSPSSWGGYPGERQGPVDIKVGTHDLAAAWVNGAGGVDVDKVRGQSFQLSVQGAGSASVARIEVDKLQADLSGSGSIILGGKAAEMRVGVRGPGSLDASALVAKAAKVSAEGGAIVKVSARDTADVRSVGTASVDVGGKPACTVSTSGSAVVTGCR